MQEEAQRLHSELFKQEESSRRMRLEVLDLRGKDGMLREAECRLKKEQAAVAAAQDVAQRYELEEATAAGDFERAERSWGVEAREIRMLSTQLESMGMRRRAAEEAKEALLAERKSDQAEMDRLRSQLREAKRAGAQALARQHDRRGLAQAHGHERPPQGLHGDARPLAPHLGDRQQGD